MLTLRSLPCTLPALLFLAGGCREQATAPAVVRDPAPPRRVIDPPGTVRPLPPYAISNDAVGPFRLGASLSAVLYELPSGPRMLLLDVPGLVKQNVIRAEDDAILVSGSVMGDVQVVAVVKQEVALTESGVAVGATRQQLGAELVAEEDSALVRDPHLAALRRLPAARLVMRDDRVAAIVLAARPWAGQGPPAAVSAKAPPSREPAKPPPTAEPARGPRCGAPRPLEDGPWQPACLSAAGELVRLDGEEVSVRSGGDGKERVLGVLRVRGLLFAKPLRAGDRADERDDLVVVSKVARSEDVTWTVASYRLESGRLVRVAEQVVYRLSAEGARWIGVALEEVEIYLELAAREDSIEVGGFLVVSAGERLRDVVALREVSIGRRRSATGNPETQPTPAPAAPVDAGALDANP